MNGTNPAASRDERSFDFRGPFSVWKLHTQMGKRKSIFYTAKTAERCFMPGGYVPARQRSDVFLSLMWLMGVLEGGTKSDRPSLRILFAEKIEAE